MLEERGVEVQAMASANTWSKLKIGVMAYFSSRLRHKLLVRGT